MKALVVCALLSFLVCLTNREADAAGPILNMMAKHHIGPGVVKDVGAFAMKAMKKVIQMAKQLGFHDFQDWLKRNPNGTIGDYAKDKGYPNFVQTAADFIVSNAYLSNPFQVLKILSFFRI